MAQQIHQCLVLSGLSGSGKTTIGKILENWIFVDGDQFFQEKKPKVTLSNGEEVSNWDDHRSIDWHELNIVMKQKLTEGNVVLATFLPMIEKYDFVVDHHIRLSTGDNAIEKCIQARLSSKTIKNVARDRRVVEELVYPIFLKICERDVDDIINVYEGRIRKSPNDLAREVQKSFDERNCNYLYVAGLRDDEIISQ